MWVSAPETPMSLEPDLAHELEAILEQRFGERIAASDAFEGLDRIESIVKHRVIRRYSTKPVDPELLRLICACALSAPSKSDLQQRDIVVVENPATRKAIADLIPDMPWIGKAPCFLVFLANGRRLPGLSRLRGKTFANDHFDLLFNAVTDAALALSTCIAAAEALGLGTCPISVIRDHAARIGELLSLPERVIPLAGLCIGWPSDQARLSPRLPLAMTLHRDRYDETGWAEQLDQYDQRREAMAPYREQRDPGLFGVAPHYGWSEDKARQYAVPQRADFGSYVRAAGFSTV
jgi:nitroreductase/FMN reductase [NAD(P)H]